MSRQRAGDDGDRREDDPGDGEDAGIVRTQAE